MTLAACTALRRLLTKGASPLNKTAELCCLGLSASELEACIWDLPLHAPRALLYNRHPVNCMTLEQCERAVQICAMLGLRTERVCELT
jgi:hypothetical protein